VLPQTLLELGEQCQGVLAKDLAADALRLFFGELNTVDSF
jgi:hypothetical protein